MDRAFSPPGRLRGVFPGPVAQAGMERPVGPRRLRHSDVCRLAEAARFGGRVVWDTEWAQAGFPLSQGKPTRPLPEGNARTSSSVRSAGSRPAHPTSRRTIMA